MSEPKEYIPVEKFCAMTGLDQAQIRKLLRNKKLKGKKFGGKWVIESSELGNTPSNKEERMFLSIEEFAKRCGIPVSRVRTWIKNGDVRAAQRGRCYLIPVNELDVLMKEAYKEE